MIKQNPFEAMKEVLEKLTPEFRGQLIEAHRKFGELRTYCEAKGYIETMPQLRGIKVLKKTPEVTELKKVIDFLRPAKFIWEDIATTAKKSKKRSAES